MTHVNYDALAADYDRRFAGAGPEPIGAALWSVAQSVGARRILEAGSGTGHWLAYLRARGAEVFGLDLSPGMLQQARQRDPRLLLTLGRAAELPFHDACFDLIVCVNALHHFDRPQDFPAAARRALRPGGSLSVVGADPQDSRNRWYVYDYFAGTLETDVRRYPPWGTIVEWMALAGFEPVEWRVAEHIRHDLIGREVWSNPFIQKSQTSQLVLLTDEAYAAGLRRIEAAIADAEAAGKAVVFPVDITLGMVTGYVPMA